ncbi:hypothetical protein [Trueperella sp. LYQ143]|uniref:hypothetical protein n=1 Tax=Trueperella sp. LYQ143 TaxID=3391059 RepID=UPI003983A6CD
MHIVLGLAVAALGLVWVVPGPGRVPRSVELRSTDSAVLLDLAAAALSAGLSIPGTLHALGIATGGAQLTTTANLLLMGAGWEEAWADSRACDMPIREALYAAWTDGAAPVPLCVRAAQSVRLARQRRAREAAARLSAQLVLPLGLCFLPAFIFLGIVPVVAGAARFVL